jgi:C-terminal processing protease CtpA/Prc
MELHTVTLQKDPLHNDFGFSVSDGVHEKGVYINKIRAGGPADMAGAVRPFDRLLQVNSTDVRDLDCMLAVPLLASAGDSVQLLLCRDPTMAVASRALYSHLEEDELSSPGSEIRHTEV